MCGFICAGVFTKKADGKEKTIAVFIESLDGYYQSGVWDGIRKVSQEKNVNIIAFVGGSLEVSPNDQYEPMRNILYEIPRTIQIDGIIISGSLCSYVSKEKAENFVRSYGDTPIVSMLPLSYKIPAATIDNRHGMRELAIHLVEEHKFTRFAFVSGPASNPEAKDRISVFKKVLEEHGIELAKENIFPGSFDRESGEKAVKKIIERNGKEIPYDAIVCVDDETAFGVIATLKEFGLSVPQNVAVTGFDNTDESKFTFPQLTTVNQPLRKLGEEALKLLLEKLDGKEVSGGVMLKTEMVKRHSCGCFFEYEIPKARIRKALIAPVATKDRLIKEDLYSVVFEIFNNSHNVTEDDKRQIWQITSSFCEDVNNQENERFLKAVGKEYQDRVMKGSNLTRLLQICKVFWHYSISHLTRETFAFADMILSRAENLRFDMLNQYEGYKQLKIRSYYSELYELKRIISNASDFDKMLSIIAKEFPLIGLDTFFMVRHKSSSANKFIAPKLVLTVKNGKRLSVKKDTDNAIFPDILTEDAKKPFIITVEPLYFRNEIFGVLYFLLDEKNEYQADIFEILGTQISDALHTEQITNRQKKEIEKEHSELSVVRHELRLGSDIQRSFLPQEIYQPQNFNIDVIYEPAREVSGDFYDIYKLDEDRIVIIIADVSGKDISSALFMALTKTLLQVLTDSAHKSGQSLIDSVYATNEYIANYNQHHNGRFMFTTLIYGILEYKTGVFNYVNAGHNPAFLFSESGVLREELKSCGPAIGLTDLAKFPIKSCVIEKGEFLFLYTDGVTDTQNSKKKFYTTKRLINKLSSRKYENAKDIINDIDKDLNDFRKNNDRFDDTTMISIYRTQ